jgi:hypothetical protein
MRKINSKALTECEYDVLEQLHNAGSKGLPFSTMPGVLYYGAPIMTWLRLTARGLVCGRDNRFYLTGDGQQFMGKRAA